MCNNWIKKKKKKKEEILDFTKWKREIGGYFGN